MSETLIIAEKPSVAATIAAALGRKREKGRVYRRKRLPCFLVRGAFGTACGSCRLWRAVQEMGL